MYVPMISEEIRILWVHETLYHVHSALMKRDKYPVSGLRGELI